MKKKVMIILSLSMLLVGMVSCKKEIPAQKPIDVVEPPQTTDKTEPVKPDDKIEPVKEETPGKTVKNERETFLLTEIDDKIIYEDKTSEIFDTPGLFIEIYPGDKGYAAFNKRDANGELHRTSYIYDINASVFEKYDYDEESRDGIYYFYNMTTDTLTRARNNDSDEINEIIKQEGRWSEVEATLKQEKEKIEDYFEVSFGEKLPDFIKDSVVGN